MYLLVNYLRGSTMGFYLKLHALTLAMHPFLCSLSNRNRWFRYGVVPLLTELISNAGKIDKVIHMNHEVLFIVPM